MKPIVLILYCLALLLSQSPVNAQVAPDVAKHIEQSSRLTGINIDSAMYFAQAALDACQARDSLSILNSLICLAYAQYHKSLNQESLGQLDKSEQYLAADYAKSVDIYAIRGHVFGHIGKSDLSQQWYLKALKQEEKYPDPFHRMHIENGLGNLFSQNGFYDEAIVYLLNANHLYDSLHEIHGLANNLNSLGVHYMDQYKDEQALNYLKQAAVLADSIGNKETKALALNNIGIIYRDADSLALAMEYFQEVYKIQKALGSERGQANVYTDIGLVALKLNDYNAALKNCAAASDINKRLEDKHGLLTDYQCLIDAYKGLGNYKMALELNAKRKIINDTLHSASMHNSLTQQRLEFEFEKEQIRDSLIHAASLAQSEIKLDREKTNRKIFSILALLSLIGAFIFYRQYRKTLIAQKRSDELLLNILPVAVAEELKLTGKTAPKRFENITVLFTDLVGFTTLSSNMRPEALVKTLDDLFRCFDDIIQSHGLEKIKTIGDAYMAVSGFSNDNSNSAALAISAAKQMLEVLESRKFNKQGLSMRIGLHSGPIVAGVVGKHKFQFDVWGDTVNTASRMESYGQEGKINISRANYELVKDLSDFSFEYRGFLEVKNKGPMEMYFAY